MDKKGELDIAHSCIAFCNTNDITLYTSRSESFASGGDSIRFQSNWYADSGGTNRPSFSAQSVGSCESYFLECRNYCLIARIFNK